VIILKSIICKFSNRLNYYKQQYHKTKTVNNLDSKEYRNLKLQDIWKLNTRISLKQKNEINTYTIFSCKIYLDKVFWHKDYVSGFEYPLKRFDKIKISKWFNKGIDVKFPWEMSRFYFAIRLAQNYVITKDEKYYLIFKGLILDWINKNSFCFGVNWICTMEVAIRAINWIVAINIFGRVIEEDEDFKKTFLKSLVQHAEYISKFPEIYENGLVSNHTTADYTGLLFLALTLKEHPKSRKWISQAINGLEECIRYQTYEDGVNFEASIPYHRLVLEMFAYSAIIARTNSLDFSEKYYELLFKMFEYSAAYMDHNGNAPQVGDNDSGRILIFHQSEEHDHSYLLDLGEHIFDYQFKSQCQKRNPDFSKWLPKIKKVNIHNLNLKPRETDKSIAFEIGGAFLLKNNNFSLMVACFPIGQNGVGGHNHYDVGSFTLSYKGQPIVVDPGSYNYTRSRKDRDKFRSMESHNIVLKEIDNSINLRYNGIWQLSEYHECELIHFDADTIKIKINNIKNYYSFIRNIKIINADTVEITDECEGMFYSLLHLYPYIQIESINQNEIDTNVCKISREENEKIIFTNYNYSARYDRKSEAIIVIMKSYNINKFKLTFHGLD